MSAGCILTPRVCTFRGTPRGCTALSAAPTDTKPQARKLAEQQADLKRRKCPGTCETHTVRQRAGRTERGEHGRPRPAGAGWGLRRRLSGNHAAQREA